MLLFNYYCADWSATVYYSLQWTLVIITVLLYVIVEGLSNNELVRFQNENFPANYLKVNIRYHFVKFSWMSSDDFTIRLVEMALLKLVVN